MADDDDLEEFVDVEDPDSPSSPFTSEVIQVTGYKSPSSSSRNGKTPGQSVSEVPGPQESKAWSTTFGSIKTNGSGSKFVSATRSKSGNKSGTRAVSGPGSQHSKKSHDSVEETSKSDEVIRKSQELLLSGKQSSLDRLSEKKDAGLRAKISKRQRQCNRQFRDMIGKREMKNEELERQQGDLRQRLNILECSMPAVMVWNIWRMTQGDNAPCPMDLHQVLEKQFQGPASGEVYCPASPSRHFDCRVRESEVERKHAQARVEEARNLWAEKMASLEDREKRLQEAKKLQLEQQRRIEQLTTEVQKLREARSTEDDGACEAGECAVIDCRRKWLEKVPSSASIRSTDIECLEKLHELAEAELCMKRQIEDLERREQAYMRTLQQADELWNCLEGEAAGSIQEQLETKTVRITELEEELRNLRSKMATCREELEKYMSIGKIEALIGRDDDFAGVSDMEALAGVSVKDGTTSGRGDMDDEMERMRARLAACRGELGKYISVEELDAIVGKEDKLDAIVGKEDKLDAIVGKEDELGAIVGMEDKLGAIVGKEDDLDAIVGKEDDLDAIVVEEYELVAIEGKADEFEMTFDMKEIQYRGLKPQHIDIEESTVMDAQKLLAQIGSLSELEGPGRLCGPGFDCNDLDLSVTGLPDEERIALEEDRVTARELLEKYGLLEIAMQMGTETSDGGIGYRTVQKSETQRTEDFGERVTRSVVEETVEREIAYDEEVTELDGVKEEEVGEQEDEVGVKEEEVGVQEDEVEVQEDEVEVQEDKVQMQEDEVEMQEDQVGVQEDEVGVQEDEVGVHEDEVGVQEDEVQVQEDEVGVQEDDIGMMKDEVGVMEDEVEVMKDEVKVMDDEVGKRASVPSKKSEEAIVPMVQLSSWQEHVHAIRLKIAECPSCDTGTGDQEAQIVSDELAAYTGRTLKFEPKERIAKDKESIEVMEEMWKVAIEEDDEIKLGRRGDDKVEFVELAGKEEVIRKPEPVDEFESVEKERKLKPEPEESVVEARTPEVVKEKVAEEYPRAETPVLKNTAVANEKVKVEEVLEVPVSRETTREPTEVKEKETVPAAEIKSERLAEVDEVKPAKKEKVLEEDEETKKEEEEVVEKKEVPTIETIIEHEGEEPEPAVKEKREVPKMVPEIKVLDEPEEPVLEEDEVEEVPVQRLEEFEMAVEVDIIPVEEEPEPEELEIVPTEIEVEVDLVEEEPIKEKEAPEEIIPLKEEPKPEEEEIVLEETKVEEIPVEKISVEEIPVEEIPVEEIPVEEIPVEEIPVEEIPVEEIPVEEIPVEETPVEEIPVEEIPVEEIPVEEIPVEEIPVEEIPVEEIPVEEISVEVVAELKPEEIVPEEEEIEVDVIPKEELLVPEEETIVEIPLEEAEEEIKAEVPEAEKIELEVKVFEDAKVAEVDVEIEIAPVEVLKEEKDEEVPEEPKEIEISFDEECVCSGVYDVEYIFPPVTEEDHPVGEEESVCQCMAEDYPPEDEEEPDSCQCSTNDLPDQEEESADGQYRNEDLQDPAGATPVRKEDCKCVCKCTSKAPSEEKTPSVKKEDSGVCKCTTKARSEEKTPSVKKEDSGVCKCTTKAPSEEKTRSVKKDDSGVCKCTSKARSEEKTPSVKKEDSGVCKCTSKARSEKKTPSVKKEDSGVCKCTSKAPSEEKTLEKGISQPPVKEEKSGVCRCKLQSPTDSTKKMPIQRDQSVLAPTASQAVYHRMEITQTSITQFEAQKTTIQAVTQTVADVGMQANPPSKSSRQHQQPKSTSRVIDTDPETLERLTRRKRSQNPSGTTTAAVTSQTEKTSFLRILQTLKTTGTYSKLEPEKELRTIHYGKKSDNVEGRCNCCLCGKTVQDTLPGQKPPVDTVQGKKPFTGSQASSVVRFLQALPLMSTAGPGVDQGVQHESRGPSMTEPKQIQTTNDQAVSASKLPSLKGSSCKPKKAAESTIAMVKVQKSGRRKPASAKSSALRSQPELAPAVAEEKLEERKEDEDLIDCICSSMGTGQKKIRCACGDPD